MNQQLITHGQHDFFVIFVFIFVMVYISSISRPDHPIIHLSGCDCEFFVVTRLRAYYVSHAEKSAYTDLVNGTARMVRRGP